MRKILILLSLVICFGCENVNISEDFYCIPSPIDNQCLTIVYRDCLFESKDVDKICGIFLYYGEYKKGDVLPSNYLKIEYDDCESLRIAWTTPIIIRYKYVLEDSLDDSQLINYLTYKEFNDNENVKTTYFPGSLESFNLDEISGKEVDRIRLKLKEIFQNRKSSDF